jgi:predicted nicotinamide N-methyase
MTNDPEQLLPADDQAVRGWPTEMVRERVIVEDRTFLIDRPAQAEHLLEDLAYRSAPPAADPLPYWAALWPGARMLSKAMLREPWIPGTEALEIGCGLGLPGIVALSAGLRVTFSDIDSMALQFAGANARLNGFADCKTLRLDWRCPPKDLRVPVLLASDLVYEVANVEPLVKFVQRVLAPGGLCLLAGQDRLPSQALREAVEDSGLSFTTKIVRSDEPGKRRVKGMLFAIQQP